MWISFTNSTERIELWGSIGLQIRTTIGIKQLRNSLELKKKKSVKSKQFIKSEVCGLKFTPTQTGV